MKNYLKGVRYNVNSKNSIHLNIKPLFRVIPTVKKMMQHEIDQENYFIQI